jgi:ATP-dependent Lon protease
MHTSNFLTYPQEDDVYWVRISGEFLKKYESWTKVDTKKRKKNIIEDSDTETENISKKLKHIELKLTNYKKNNGNNMNNLHNKLMTLQVETPVLSYIMDKYNMTKDMSGSEHSKGMNWLTTVSKIPFGNYKQIDNNLDYKLFFKNIKSKMDNYIYGLDDIKQEILEFVARKITNPNGKGEVLALCSNKGLGKTKLLTSLSEALDLPLFQINCGGLDDGSILVGHNETYVGAKPGKIVDYLQTCKYMNPIFYFDEIDKLGERRGNDISGILTHLLDEEQNKHFQDNYLGNIPLDLSKSLFVISFNDISKVNPILADRMKVLYIEKPSLEQKVEICSNKVIPDILQNINRNINVNIDKEVIEYVISRKCNEEDGVRQVKKVFEKLINKLNYDILVSEIKCSDVYNITRTFVDSTIQNDPTEKSFMSMYS